MSSDFCIKCDNALAVYCGKCVDAERAFERGDDDASVYDLLKSVVGKP